MSKLRGYLKTNGLTQIIGIQNRSAEDTDMVEFAMNGEHGTLMLDKTQALYGSISCVTGWTASICEGVVTVSGGESQVETTKGTH